jgi:hypothetical protein
LAVVNAAPTLIVRQRQKPFLHILEESGKIMELAVILAGN